jgi:hypothetical protein
VAATGLMRLPLLSTPRCWRLFTRIVSLLPWVARRATRLGQLHREGPAPPAAPMTSTCCPAWTSPSSRSAWRAANPEMGTAPACSKPRVVGSGAKWSSGAQASSA